MQGFQRAYTLLSCFVAGCLFSVNSTNGQTGGDYKDLADNCHIQAPKKVIHDILLQDAAAVSTAPTGRRILAKFKRPHSYELVVKDLQGGQVFSSTSSHSQVELSWSPDGRSLLYMARLEAGKPFHIFRWNLLEGPLKLLALPESDEATAPIQWKPQGDAFLYATKDKASTQLRLVRFDGASVIEKSVATISAAHGYAWDADGTHFFAVAKADERTLVLFDQDGRLKRKMTVQGVDQIDSIALSKTGDDLLVSAKSSSEQWLHLLKLNQHTGQQTSCLRYEGDLRLPLAMSDGQIIVSLSSEDKTVLRRAHCGGPLHPIGPNDGLVIADALSPDNRLLYASYVGTTKPGILVSIDTRSGTFTTLYQTPQAAQLTIPPPERLTIPAADGGSIHGLLWRSRAPMPFGHRVVVSAHGGGAGWFILQQIVLSAGADYVVLQDRSEAGFGKAFEKDFRPETHVDDIVRGMQYVVKTLHPLNGKIVLEGSSYGAYLAVHAAIRNPELLESLVVESMTGNGPSDQPTTMLMKPVVRTYQFHGENDPGLSPSAARRMIESLLGPNVSSPPSGCLKVFQNEGHTISDAGNVAAMWGILASIVRNRPDTDVLTVAGTP